MTTANLYPHLLNGTKNKSLVTEKDILSGDTRAFEQLVREESPRLYRMIFRIIKNEDEARSVLQETFLQAYVRLSTFRGDSKLTTWIYSIGLNLARAKRREASKVRVLDHSEIEALEPQFAHGNYLKNPKEWDAGLRLEHKERKRVIHEAIQRLPEQYQTIVNLRDINGLTTEDVALLLNISHGAVRVRLHRARRALKKLLVPYSSGSLMF